MGPEQWVTVAGRRLKVTNLDKVMYPATRTTKADVIAYYAAIAPVLIPQAAWRPVTRKRWVEGVGTAEAPGGVFFRKDLEDSAPDWVPRASIEHSSRTNTYPLANHEAVLAWFAQLAALELHVPQWRFDRAGVPQNPDRMVIDLDPGEGVTLADCAHVARLCREVLVDMGLDAVPVTSGSKGIHLYAPLPGTHTSAEVSEVAHEFARAMEADHPDLVVSLQRKVLREGKVLIDWSQNSAAKTTVCPYSLRGRLHPTVAAPRTWDELAEPDLRQLGHEEVLARVAQGIDPIAAQGWRGPLDGGDDDGDGVGDGVSPDDVPARGSGRDAPDRLATYRSMRDAGRTPEPVPAGPPTPSSGNSFVIQEHHARRLHWDFRLERDGVLVSWAVPKGPPLSSGRNRLAVHTEDHPLEYGTFAGEIPKGEYGGGTVTIWDSGTYETEKWRDDEVIAVLTGRPDGGLGGVPRRYALIRTGRDEEDTWLLHLMKDQPAPTEPRPPESASEPEPTSRPSPEREATLSAAGVPAITDLPLPMLATPGTAEDVTGPGWAYEMKWDGVRAIVGVGGGGVVVMSRNGNDVTATYPEIAELADRLVADGAVLDGEIVALNEAGRPDFGVLQPRMKASAADAPRLARRTPVHLMLFDLLALTVDGETRGLMRTPYRDRRALLRSAVEEGGHIHVPDSLEGTAEDALAASRELGLEGIVAKRVDGHYLPGRRGRSWVKVKHHRTQEVVVIGWRRTESGRSGISSLLLAVPDDGALAYVGRVGSGFTESDLSDAAERLQPLARETVPVDDVPALDRRDAVWVEPALVGEVTFGERTAAGRLRHPVWRGWRPDKAPDDVRWEA